jgi:hypothetical protein
LLNDFKKWLTKSIKKKKKYIYIYIYIIKLKEILMSLLW